MIFMPASTTLLRVITEGGLLASLERGEASLVFLGDLIHSQEAGELENMESSIFILDLYSMLKLRFPDNIYYVHGNHERFFSRCRQEWSVAKVVLFRKYLKKRRGKTYVAEIETLFSKLAFVVQGNDFAACHGAPVRSKVNRSTLVNIRRLPGYPVRNRVEPFTTGQPARRIRQRKRQAFSPDTGSTQKRTADRRPHAACRPRDLCG